MDRSESIGEFKVTNCDLKDNAQHKPPYRAQLGRGQAVPTQNKTNKTLARPRRIQAPLNATGSGF